jgi:hypothetical protein
MNKRLIKSNDGGVAVPTSFNTVLYNGNSSTNVITGVGFQPDLVWMKNRNSSNAQQWTDSVRGVTKNLFSNLTNAEFTETITLQSFNSDGFTLGSETRINGSGLTFVAWCWKAGGAAVTAASVEATSATRSANPEAGFSVIKFTASNSTASPPPMNYIEHGLDSTPKMVIYKPTNVSGAWRVMHVDNGQKWIELQSTAATAGPFTYTIWDNTPTSIGVRSNYAIGRGDTHIAYCFAEVAGFSKFGSFTGNGVSGRVIDCGFEPAFVLVKITNGVESWVLFDNKRNGDPKPYLLPNNSAIEATVSTYTVQMVSNGFRIDVANTGLNAIGSNFIYMAFANQF